MGEATNTTPGLVCGHHHLYSTLARGMPAPPKTDRVTWSYDPMDPWHLAFTPGVRPLEIEVDSEVVFADGRPTRVDADEIRARAAEQAARLHARL